MKNSRVFVANDETPDFRQKLEFWKICIFYNKAESLSQVKDFSDEMSSDRSKCYFYIV